MIKITKNIEYALMALKFMKGKSEGELTTAREICDKFEIPFDPMAKVMQKLGQHNILTSIQGVKGGYQLKKNLSEVSFMALSKMIEGDKEAHDCFTAGHVDCQRSGLCNIKRPMKELHNKMTDFLERVKLSELLGGE